MCEVALSLGWEAGVRFVRGHVAASSTLPPKVSVMNDAPFDGQVGPMSGNNRWFVAHGPVEFER